MRFLPISLGLCLLATCVSAQHAPNASLEPGDLAEFAAQPARVQELIAAGLALTKRNLDYTFGSDDPANGGMDCSGTMYHLLREHGWKDVPRDSPGQYEWVRAAGGFHEVVGSDPAGAEFAALQPGDLMFWSGTYETHREGVAVSHVMLYLGTEAKTRQRVMFGASDGRTYHGVQRFGVSVFDFKMPRAEQKARFLGYGRIPGLPRGTPAVIATVPPPVVVEEEGAPSSGAKKKSATAKSKASASEDGVAKSRSKAAQAKADIDDDAVDAAKAKTPARKSKPGQKSKTTAQEKADSPEPSSNESTPKSKTAKTGTSKSKTNTGKSKASTEEPAVEVIQSDAEAPKSKAKSTKSKGTADASSTETDAGAKKPGLKKSEVQSAKTPAGKSKTPALESKSTEQTTKAGFQKPRTDPSEPSSEEPKTKPVGGFQKQSAKSEDAETTPHQKTPTQKRKPGTKPKTPEANVAE